MYKIVNDISMKKLVLWSLISMLMTLSFTACSSASDDTEFVQTTAKSASFSLLSFTQSQSQQITSDESTRSGMDEKLSCKVLADGKLQLTHKNVVFDMNSAIQMSARLEGNKIVVSETGAYGESNAYGYYTLVATVGSLNNGDYTIVMMRNGNVRAEFRFTYDSSKANN